MPKGNQLKTCQQLRAYCWRERKAIVYHPPIGNQVKINWRILVNNSGGIDLVKTIINDGKVYESE